MASGKKKNVIIDTDPGIDDALALLLAVASPDEIGIEAVTTVAGNVPLAATMVNARRVLHLAGRRDIPVFAGASHPLLRPLHMATENHGINGIGNITLPDMPGSYFDDALSIEASDYLVQAITSAPEKALIMVCLGPLTNLALALRKSPGIAARLAEVVIIGGSVFAGGNVTPVAEFNFYVDPDAAAEVMASEAKLTVIPWDAAKQCLTSAARRQLFAALGAPLGPIVREWLDAYRAFDEAMWNSDGGAMPDPLAIAYLLRPDIFQGRSIHLAIETQSDLMRGAACADWWNYTGQTPNATLLKDVDAESFFNLLAARLRLLNESLVAESSWRTAYPEAIAF